MKRDRVVIPAAARGVVLDVMRGQLQKHGVEVVAMSVGGMHAHVLGRFGRVTRRLPRAVRTSAKVDDPVRHCMGIAKRQASRAVLRSGVMSGAIWAKRGKIKPIADRAHQVRVVSYILEHAREGAAVWWWKQG